MTLLEAIFARHSVRKYLDKEIPADIIAALQDKIEECNKSGNLHIQLVQNESKAFTGMLSYGSFSGVKNYFVMVGKKSKDLDERVGYYGEQLVLFAQTLGLNTCWVVIERENAFNMEQFAASVNEFLTFRRYALLPDKGKISREEADRKAEEEYKLFNPKQKIDSDFDKEIRGLFDNKKE